MKPSTLRTLRLLEQNESVTTHDLMAGGCGSRYSARIHELRDLGYVISEQRLTDGRAGSRYKLLGSPEPAGDPDRPQPPEEGCRVDDAVCQAGCSASSAPGLFDADEYRERLSHWDVAA